MSSIHEQMDRRARQASVPERVIHDLMAGAISQRYETRGGEEGERIFQIHYLDKKTGGPNEDWFEVSVRRLDHPPPK